MKKYFSDGLIQLALLLSLLYRTDVDNYLNTYYSNYPEIHEIILGTSSAYTQTHFHSQSWHEGLGGYNNLKHLDNYYASSVFQELNSLGYHRQFDGVDTSVGAWLVIPGGVQHANEQEQSNSQNDQNNNNGSGHGNSSTSIGGNNTSSSSSEPDGPLGHAELPEESVTTGNIQDQMLSAVFPGTELTKEDMDLIEVLWKQDIDLGVGREMFDQNLRKELEEKERLELKKQQEKEKELEDIKQEPVDQLANNFIIDGETGEMIPAPPGENTEQPVPLTNMPPQIDEPSEVISIEDAMRMLEQQSENEALNTSELTTYNNSQLQQEIGNMIDNAERYSQGGSPMPDYQRQVSLEQRWQDLASILELPPASTTPSATATATATSESSVDILNNNTMNVLNTLDTLNSSLDNSTGPLIHNTTMLPSPQMQANFTPFSPIMEFPPSTQGLGFESLTTPDSNTATPLIQNATMPSMNTPPVFGLDPENFSLQNMTGGELMNQTSNFSQSTSLLQNLLEQDDMMNELDFPDVNITQGVESMQVKDDASDSAVSSMGSSASPMQDLKEFNDSHSNMSSESGSPYDGLEGAIGGSYDPESSPKYTKYEKHDSGYSYAESGYEQSDMQTNLSNSSNDSNYGYQAAEMRHVNHNHTYPLQPGQQSRESRKASREAEKARSQEGRDEKRAKELKIPIPMATIVNAPVDEFSELIQKYTLNEQQLQLMRDIRRRGKNKVAAQHCRKRKLEVISSLEEEVEQLKADKERLYKERLMIDKERKETKEKFGHLYEEVFQSLRDDHGQPYNPQEYSLEQTADGNVFLVPLNATASDDQKHKSSRRRKPKDR